MAKMAFLATFRLIWLTKLTLEVLRNFFLQKPFKSYSSSTLTPKMSKIPKPPLMAHCGKEAVRGTTGQLLRLQLVD